MRTFLIVLLTALLSLIGAWVLMQEGLIPGLGWSECKSTQIVKTYEDGECPINTTWKECTTPWWTTVAHWDLVLSFEHPEATLKEWCISKTSICNDWSYVNNDDPYDNETCVFDTSSLEENLNKKHCTVNGFVFADGTSQTFYTLGKLTDGKRWCDSQVRSCDNWVVSGDSVYEYYSCHWAEFAKCLLQEENEQEEITTKKPTPKPVIKKPTSSVAPVKGKQPNCPNPFGGYRWEPWQTGTAYKSATVPHWESCESTNIVCSYGSIRYWTANNPWWIVSWWLSQDCIVLPPNPCSSPCGTIPHWENVITYPNAVIPYGNGQTCQTTSISSTCNDGVLSPWAWSSCSCDIAPPSPCVAPNWQTVAHESSLTLYQFAKIQALPWDWSDICNRQRRQCINGSFYDWNGVPAAFTYQYPSCDVIEPPAWWWPGWNWIPTT